MEIVTEFKPDTGYRFPAVYPWDAWTDGKIREAARGVDYTCRDESFRGILHNRAKHLNLDVRTQRTAAGTRFQFKPLPDTAQLPATWCTGTVDGIEAECGMGGSHVPHPFVEQAATADHNCSNTCDTPCPQDDENPREWQG